MYTVLLWIYVCMYVCTYVFSYPFKLCFLFSLHNSGEGMSLSVTDVAMATTTTKIQPLALSASVKIC